MESAWLRPLDGVRALAALAVVAFHTWRYGTRLPATGVGERVLDAVASRLWLGLTMFFVLSGFLLFRPWAEYALGRRDTAPHLGRYARARVLRIVPGYWFALAAVVVLMQREHLQALLVCAPVIAYGVIAPRSRRVGAAAAAIALIPCVWSLATHGLELGRFLPSLAFAQIYSGHWGVIGPAWTLDVEVTFYLSLPVIGAFVAWNARRYASGTALVVAIVSLAPIFVVAPVFRSLAAEAHGWRLALPSSIDQFGAGMVIALLVAAWPSLITSNDALRSRAMLLLGATIIALDAALVGAPTRPLTSTWFDGIAGVGLAIVVLGIVGGGATTERLLWRGPLAWVGVVSYGVYLWHEPILHAVHGYVPYVTGRNYVVALAGITGLALCGALAQWFLAEGPALQRRRRMART